MATTTPMRMIMLLFLPVLLLSTVQLGHGAVHVRNVSSFNVTVYDTNTTVILDTLESNETTTFPMDTVGPDFFVVTKQNNQGSCSSMVKDNEELLIYGTKKAIYCTITPRQWAPASAPS